MVCKLFNNNFKLRYKWYDIISEYHEMFNKLSIGEKRNIYWSQNILKMKRKLIDDKKLTKEEKDFCVWGDMEDFQCTKDEYVKKQKDKTGVTFAVVKDGKWYERGEMGWWGIVSNEKNRDDWNEEFQKLVKGLSDDMLLTVVDCHI
jgi:hypothetical protein